tara:strand:+ start:88472 stop:89647 length:1176 start_codon:yes stop_codon:yes gene_type:complete
MPRDSPLLLDVSRLIWRAWRQQLPTGIDRACLAYVRHYRNRARAVVQRGGFTRVLNERDSQQLFALLLDAPSDFRWRLIGLMIRSLLSRSTPRSTLRGALYLNIGHTGLDRPGHGRWVKRCGVRAIYYVHDLIPITHPQFSRTVEPQRHAARMAMVLRHAEAVIANSRDSIVSLTAFATEQGLSMRPFLCAPLGIEPPLAVAHSRCPLAAPYFVILGTIEGRKNHRLLLAVWRRLIERCGEHAPKLVIIGQRGWSAEDVTHLLDSDAVLRPHVDELGRCADEELHRYLVHARALLFPSFAEGQGLPLIEALALGTPVVASDLAVFRETAGDIPDYLDPRDEKAWLDAVLDYGAPDSARRAAQIARMKGFAAPTWQDHFEKVENWLDRLSDA